jgi:hypothetical protein
MSNRSDISLVQIPQSFRQIHIDSALIQIDRLYKLFREWDQRLLVFAIDLQNVGPASEHIGNRADVLAVCRVHTATFQLEGVNPTFLCCRQRIGGNFDLDADVLLGFRDTIDSFELSDAASMLAAKRFDLRLALRALTGHDDFPSGRENLVFFEQLLDSDFTAEALSLRDPRYGYVRGFWITDEALLQNLEREPLFQFHSGGTQNRSDRTCGSSLLSNDLSEIGLSNP